MKIATAIRMRVVLDTSVAANWFVDGSRDPYAARIFEQVDAFDFWVPDLWWIEICNVFAKAVRRGAVSLVHAQRALGVARGLPAHWDSHVTKDLDSAIFNVAIAQNLSAQDSVFLNLAVRERIPIATRDEKLADAAKSLQLFYMP